MKVVVDGVGTLEFPDGTDHQVIRSTVQDMVAKSGKPTPSLGPAPQQESTANWLASSALHGGLDTAGGVAQLVSRGADALGMPKGTDLPFIASPEIVQQNIAQARQDVTNRFGEPGGIPRGLASAAVTLPLTPMKFMQAPTLLGRTTGAGVAGGVAAGLQEVPSGDGNLDFLKQKAKQVFAGGVAGALMQPAGEALVGAGSSALNLLGDKAITAGRNISGANSTDKLVALVRESLKKGGIDFGSLSETTKQSLIDDVTKATSQFSGTNPGAIARQAAFREEGFDPLRHWITRNPAEFTSNENLAGVSGVGDPLKQRMADLDSHIIERLNALRGGAKTDAVTSGQAVKKDVSNYLKEQEGKTNVLYRTFREIAPGVNGDAQRFVNDVYGGLDGQMALGSLPGGIKNIIDQVSKGNMPASPTVLYQLQKMLKPGTDGSTNFALGHVSKAIDREMNAISQTLETATGDQKYAADVLQMARKQHASTKDAIESSPTLQAVDAGTFEPEKFFRGFLDGNSISEMSKTWVNLGEDAKAGIRARLVDHLKSKAFGAASDEAGKPAAQATFNNYLAGDGMERKIEIILGKDGLAQVKRLGTMMESAHMQPSGSKVNNSNTASAALSFGTGISDAMVRAGIMGGRPLQAITRGANADIAMQPGADALGTRSVVINPEIEKILKRLTGGLLSIPAGVGAATYPGLLGQ